MAHSLNSRSLRPVALRLAPRCIMPVAIVVLTSLSAFASTPQTVTKGVAQSADSDQMTVMLPGDVPLVLVRVPAGTFQMGSPPGERGNVFDNEEQHQVTLTHDSYIGQTEVTQQQWEAVMGSPMPSNCGTLGMGDDYPVYCVTWDRIAGPGGFLEKLNQELGTTIFRLPTEAEWERAARAGTTTRFSYGDVLACGDNCEACSDHEQNMWYCGDASSPMPVGQKLANPYGLFDMNGGLWEIVNDRYGDFSADPVTDPTGPDTTTGDIVIRGGGWHSEAMFARSATRISSSPDDRAQNNEVGFRLAATAEDTGSLSYRYFFPAAAKAGGIGTSFFVTDVTVNNAGSTTATYAFQWLPRNTDNSQPTESEMYTLAPGQSVVYTDVLGAAFNLQDGAVGALGVASDSPSLLLMSRTYNQVAGVGTFGQAIPGYAEGDLIPSGVKKRLVFFVENASYRSNLGLMNGTGASLLVQWERFTPDGMSVKTGSTDLPPWGTTQLNQVFADDAPVNGGYVDVWSDTEGGAFAAYGSMLDNQTSDPTTILPQ